MTTDSDLRQTLRPRQVAALAIGCVIGFGCFVLPGDFLTTAGPVGATLGVLGGGGAMLIIARSYGVMVRALPVAGAEFAYAYRVGWSLPRIRLWLVPGTRVCEYRSAQRDRARDTRQVCRSSTIRPWVPLHRGWL